MKSVTQMIGYKVNVILFNYFVLVYLSVNGEVTTTSPEKFCSVPASFVDKTVSYKCYGDAAKSCYKNGDTTIPQFTVANFECNQGYVNDQGNKFRSVCLESEWIPPIYKCNRICDKLNPVNVDLTCYYKGNTIDCEDNLFPGTKVRPICKPLHTNKDFINVYKELTCLEDGKWDHALFSCIPECGRLFNNSLSKIMHKRSTPQRYIDSPWHVTIYDIKKNILLCGGTIISSRIVLSAAYCFYDQINDKILDANNFEVVVSKATTKYSDIDNNDQRSYKIKEIRFSNRGFRGSSNYFASDIAILILSGKISSSLTVLPACVDWTYTDVFHPPEETPGKIVNWSSEDRSILQTDTFAFISRSRCFNSTARDLYPFLTSDKFCAKINDGRITSGNSGEPPSNIGTGLVFREGSAYFVRGILSQFPMQGDLSLFIDVATHIDWILSVRNEVEENVLEKQFTIKLKNKSR